MRNDAFRTARSRFLAAMLVAVSSLLMSSCGGGGAAGNPTIGGALTVIPGTGTAYAGIPFTVTIAGGRPPYALGSSEPTIFPVPTIMDANTFEVLPGQPGVVDVGLEPNEVPRRAVVLTARDVNGLSATANYSVLQNFLVGYGVSYLSNCPAPQGSNPPQFCPGGTTAASVAPTFRGQLRGNALLRFERIRGNFGFTQCGSPPPANTALVSTITQNTDTQGTARVCIFVPPGASGTNVYRIIDAATGVYSDQLFFVTTDALGVIPSTIEFTGTNGRCGTGSSDFLVFGGTPPYSATSPDGRVQVSPTSNTVPGRFSVTVAVTQQPCPTNIPVIVTDSAGGRTTVTVNSVIGPAGPPLTVAPTSFNLQCGQSGTAVVVGGTGTYSAFSSGGGVTASAAGNQIFITRTSPSPAFPVGTQQTSVNVTDGNSIVTITVDSPLSC